MQVKVTPYFDEQDLISKTLAKNWFEFQNEAMILGDKLLAYMRDYINANRHRSGGSGNLANTITINKVEGAGAGKIFWGIGSLDELNAKAVYWYVLNYGAYFGTKEAFIPGKGKGQSVQEVPGFFGSNNPPDGSMKGKGTESFTYSRGGFIMTPGPIRPINYLQSTQRQFDTEMKILIDKFGK